MFDKHIRVLFITIIGLMPLFLHGQSMQRSAFVSSSAMNSGQPSLESSFGELMVDSYFSSSTILTQGFIQNDLYIPNGTPVDLGTLRGKAFPNPVISVLNVQIDFKDASDVTIEVIDVLGKKRTVNTRNSLQGNTTILELEVDRLESGIYFIRVISDKNQYNQVFKVTKAS